MKKFTLAIAVLLFALGIALGLLSSGCSTVTHTLANGTTTTNSIPDPAIMQTVAQEASAVGTTFWLQGHPQDRPQFELARTSLRSLVAAGSGDVATLQQALSDLPIKQLSGTNGQVIVSGAVVLIDAAGRELARLDSKNVYQYYVQPVAQGILSGLDQALGPKQ